jgi:uncharacterized protein
MRFVVIFEDEPARADVRPKLMPDHLAFLKANADKVMAAGPLLDAGGAGAGGLWMVEAADADAVMSLVHADPFWPAGLRKSVRVLQWKRVFDEGRSLL